MLLQVRTICPPEMTLRPLYRARLLHLPLSLALFYLLLPGGEADAFSTLPARVLLMRRVPPDCALLVFAVESVKLNRNRWQEMQVGVV